jgi:phosphatidylethanolamine/phosphatidyl-N-methylethanolamine N-methyltransferase
MERAREEWMKIWLEQYMTKPTYVNLLERFNHGYPLKSAKDGARTLEIGAGVGAHLGWENLGNQDYYCNELRPELCEQLVAKYPRAHAVLGDCQKGLDFPDNHFDRVIAVHVLEHLLDLPRALLEIARILKPSGRFSVVIPCEGGKAYDVARFFSAKRLFEKRFPIRYEDYIRTEHVNQAYEVLEELDASFRVEHRSFYPLAVPIIDANLLIGLTLAPKKESRA